MRWPSGLNATLDTESVWPVSGGPIGWPVSASHTRTVLSALPETMRWPSGLNATLDTALGVAGQRLADRLAGVGVPQPHRLVGTAGDDPVAVGAERHAGHRVGVAGQRLADRLAGVGVPHPHRLVGAAGDDAVAVGAERHAVHRVGVAGERLRRRVGRCRRPTPAPSCRRCRRRCGCPSGLNATLDHRSVWPVSGGPIGLAGVGVPHPHRLVGTAGDDPVPVGAERHTRHRAGVAGRAAGRPVGRCRRPTAAPCCRQLPETIRWPSGLNATLITASVWPVSGWPTGWPVSASHSRTVLSQLPETMRCPSGLNATLVTALGVAGERLADGLAGVGVPQPHRVVVAAGDDAVAVGAERHAGHRVRCARSAAGRSGWPVSASHSRTVLSSLPETMRLPSGLNATLVTASVWPVSGWPIGWPVSASHTRTVLVGAAGDDAVAVGAERHAAHSRRPVGDLDQVDHLEQRIEQWAVIRRLRSRRAATSCWYART